ncbi:DNA topoisomerase (ATP-hydrolyzing) subunit A [Treponema pallidum]|uniref:DNA gyrase subunit A n=2 Tax=Treponema pallidum TaxID=160 RepID=A0AAU8Q0A2_TREPG|nr:DNA topoisomerase (ATP-hydrolyzing) subunit A [Treponema pallidum]AEZ57123.1 cDP-diacylglycerol--glycerol-3-phosphate 3-phosphatidyltransferase [Treponema pallidum subsp. pertenue str. SamoaD]AEZ58191.1 cDP-diacylglycerol--glycerol-3-phosphate 3-phosphatidyltransferase [Treponema pallidum subsp. pertenue str. CDC2]AEZ59259.1 cDP-diacylglycerol--glycerol-3-phosphate 3-phosphatidyltransferase [Treponema pallidum subsp. pertenue str. Gauthier]ASV57653.1 cDP-diacylglycerol--glycerol-3-phosphate 
MEEISTPEGGVLVPISIETEVKRAYIDYSMSVIVSRALPDVRDGLKPVHRRILYAMEEKGLRFSGPTRKCAKIVGDVLGSFHPHGDASVYDALVRLGQDFSLRYPVIHPQGNFGTIGGDPPAAYRYTEAKMARIAESMVEDIKKETVSFVPNFDDSDVEPTVLPGRFPFLLANGSSGIAVGMTTNMPPHNLREIAAAISAYIENPNLSIQELCDCINGPDFPTGGIIFGKNGIRQSYETGRGKIVVRARFTIETDSKGRDTIIFTEVPYQVNTTMLVMRIGELARAKVIEGIANVNDETSDRTGLRIVVELKKGTPAQVVLNHLFAKTPLQSSFNVINLALVEGRPRMLTLKDLVRYFVEHRVDVVTRRAHFELRKAQERIHLVRALIRALDAIDKIITLIRHSQNTELAKQRLREQFDFDNVQAQAIVDMQMKRLTGLEVESLRTELKDLTELISSLEELLTSPQKVLGVVKKETRDIADMFGDDRRTDIVSNEIEYLDVEDFIQKEEMVILISHLGYIKRVPVSAYRNQNRGGKGSSSANLAAHDFISQIFTASTHDYVMFVTSRGRAYWLKVYGIPESGRANRGSHIKSLLMVATDEEITAIVSLREFSNKSYVFMATARGVVKKVTTDNFVNAKTRGIIALKLSGGDTLVSAVLVQDEDEVMLITRQGKALRMSGREVREMGRNSSGVIGIKLTSEDLVAGVLRVSEQRKVLIMTENGYGKRVSFSEFSVHGRGTAGQKIYTQTDRKGAITGALAVLDTDECMCITGQGKTIRVDVCAISVLGRGAQGVRVLDIEPSDLVVGLSCVMQG